MRGIWPPIIFISTALHLIVGVAILLPLRPGTSDQVVPSPAAARAEPVTMLLRSQDVCGQGSRAVTAAERTKLPSSAALLVSAAPAMEKPVFPPAPALALRDKNQVHVRSMLESAPGSMFVSAADCRKGVVFVLDISGSMYEPYGSTTRLTVAREILGGEIRRLKEGTPFALVVYGETARRNGPLLPATDAARGAALDFLAQEFNCGGGTNLPIGLALASELQAGAVVVVTDGDLNMKPAELLPKVRESFRGGSKPALTIVGIGPRAHTDAEALLHELVHQQGGVYQAASEVAQAPDLSGKISNVAAR